MNFFLFAFTDALFLKKYNQANYLVSQLTEREAKKSSFDNNEDYTTTAAIQNRLYS